MVAERMVRVSCRLPYDDHAATFSSTQRECPCLQMVTVQRRAQTCLTLTAAASMLLTACTRCRLGRDGSARRRAVPLARSGSARDEHGSKRSPSSQ